MLSHLKLGANPSPPKPQDLHFKAYLAPNVDQLIEAAMAPGALNWQKVPTASGDMPRPNRDPLNNDIHGNCILAGMANLAMRVSQMVGQPRVITGGSGSVWMKTPGHESGVGTSAALDTNRNAARMRRCQRPGRATCSSGSDHRSSLQALAHSSPRIPLP